MNKKQNWSKKEKTKATLSSSAGLINIFSDPVARFLKGAILNEYDGERLMCHYSCGIALIEKDGQSANEVIENTIVQVRHVDPAIEFVRADFKNHNQKRYLQTVKAKLNKMVTSHEKNHLTIHVIENITDCFEEKEMYRLFNELFNNLSFYNIFIFNQQSYQHFSNKFDLSHDMHEVWINRQPGEMDFFHKDQKHSHERLNKVYINNRIFTPRAQNLIDRAHIEAELMDEKDIDPYSLLSAASEGTESGLALMQCHNLSEDKLALIRKHPFKPFESFKNENAYFFDLSGAEVIKNAVKLASASGYPDHNNPGLVSDCHIICALAMYGLAKEPLLKARKLSFDSAVRKIGDWYYRKKVSSSITGKNNALGNVGFLQGLCRELRGNLFGQDHTLEALRQLLCNSLLRIDDGDRNNRRENHLFFLGPENVGKMHLARLFAVKQGRSFCSYDMLYFDDTDLQSLCAVVKDNKNAVIAFDNIEKAAPGIIKSICRVLDSRHLIYENETFDFTFTTIVLISSLGQGISNVLEETVSCESAMKKKAASLLLRLSNKLNPMSGQPYFPFEIASRIKKDQLILFNSLRIEDLFNICEKKLNHHCKVIEEKIELRITVDPLLSFAIICREGGMLTPRTIHTAVENLLNREVEKFVDGKSSSSAEFILTEFDRIHFALPKQQHINQEISKLFKPEQKPKVLLLADKKSADFYASNVDSVEWHPIYSIEELELFDNYMDFDFAIFDLWLNDQCTEADKINIIKNFTRYRGVDINRLPLTVIAQKIFGPRYLQLINDIGEQLPLIMFNLNDETWEQHALEDSNRPTSSYLDAAEQLSIIDDQRPHDYIMPYSYFRYDLFFEFLLSIKARGCINTVFTADSYTVNGKNNLLKNKAYSLIEVKKEFYNAIDLIYHRIHRERKASEIDAKNRFFDFETEWEFDDKYKLVTVRLENMHLTRSNNCTD